MKEWDAFVAELQVADGKMNGSRFLQQTALAGFVLFAATGCLALLTEQETFVFPLALIGSFLATGVLLYFGWSYRADLARKNMETNIPDLLLQASIFPAGTPLTEILAHASQNDFGLLSGEFSNALQEIRRGAPVPLALQNISLRTRSAIVDRAVQLLLMGYRSGMDTAELFRETAEDLLKTQGILAERRAGTLIQKYTLLLAGSILVPLILGLIAHTVTRMDFGAMNGMMGGMSAVSRQELLAATLLANQIYIAEYAVLASVFAAFLEGRPKKSILYVLFLLPFSLLLYNGIQLT
ncbi:MAG: type II secretion system F family protein [Candidatus Diapherotrites archaeon]|nr:type II secretion system F family protein [Candidatus Diapherotrites archaeon]